MDQLVLMFEQFNVYAKSNPIVAGAVSLWGLGFVTWLLRNVPADIYQFVKRQLTTVLTFNNTSVGTNLETFANFMRWYEQNYWARFSRSLSLNGAWDEAQDRGTVVGMGNGLHFFIYKRRLFWLYRSQMTQGSMYQVTYEIHIRCLSRNRQVLLDLIEEFRYKPAPNKIGIYALHERDWVRMTDVGRRPLSTVIVDPEISNDITSKIDRFLASRSWYEDRGLAYSLTFMLCGIGGTGKSSLISAIASHYSKNICRINLASLSDSGLEHALATAPKDTIIVIEDFDSAHATKARVKREPEKAVRVERRRERSKDGAPTKAEGNTIELATSFLTLSGILNALQGVVPLDGRIIFMTTNVPEQIDPALTRKGRVTEIYELKRLRHPEVCRYIKLMFPQHSFAGDEQFADILGCDLEALYKENNDNLIAFVKSIPRKLEALPSADIVTLPVPAGSNDDPATTRRRPSARRKISAGGER